MKDKEKLRNCHTWEETKGTATKGSVDRLLGQRKDASGKPSDI